MKNYLATITKTNIVNVTTGDIYTYAYYNQITPSLFWTINHDGYSYISEIDPESTFYEENFYNYLKEDNYKRVMISRAVNSDCCNITFPESYVIREFTQENLNVQPFEWFFYDGTGDNRPLLLDSIILSKKYEAEYYADLYNNDYVLSQIPSYKLYGLLLETKKTETENDTEAEDFKLIVGRLRDVPDHFNTILLAIKNNSSLTITQKIQQLIAYDLETEVRNYVFGNV